mmetsp:Transcript_1705/g.7605  ORF Transcript_1705/g.7605 Transcript_1705/m.7605 type:complete len:307 (-) Transcript_1705:1255-2175(-)
MAAAVLNLHAHSSGSVDPSIASSADRSVSCTALRRDLAERASQCRRSANLAAASTSLAPHPIPAAMMSMTWSVVSFPSNVPAGAARHRGVQRRAVRMTVTWSPTGASWGTSRAMYAMRSGSSPSTNFPFDLPTPEGGVIATATLDANAPARLTSSTVRDLAAIVDGSDSNPLSSRPTSWGTSRTASTAHAMNLSARMRELALPAPGTALDGFGASVDLVLLDEPPNHELDFLSSFFLSSFFASPLPAPDALSMSSTTPRVTPGHTTLAALSARPTLPHRAAGGPLAPPTPTTRTSNARTVSSRLAR